MIALNGVSNALRHFAVLAYHKIPCSDTFGLTFNESMYFWGKVSYELGRTAALGNTSLQGNTHMHRSKPSLPEQWNYLQKYEVISAPTRLCKM